MVLGVKNEISLLSSNHNQDCVLFDANAVRKSINAFILHLAMGK